MDWTAPIDIYCERLSPGFWAEPANALSNLAFIVAAATALAAQRRKGPDLYVTALIFLVFAIGIGSFLFHTFANRWSSLADVLPITLFIYAYLALALRRFVGLKWPVTIVALAIFLGLTVVIEDMLRPLLSGSAAYAPALLAMVGIGALLAQRRHPASLYVLAAGGIFLVSLTLRTLDQPLCPAWPVGTHLFWHLLNGATLSTLLFAAIRDARPAA